MPSANPPTTEVYLLIPNIYLSVLNSASLLGNWQSFHNEWLEAETEEYDFHLFLLPAKQFTNKFPQDEKPLHVKNKLLLWSPSLKIICVATP